MDEVKKLGLLKLKAVAQHLGVSPLTLTREAERGRLKMVRIGGQKFVQADALRDYLVAAGVQLAA